MNTQVVHMRGCRLWEYQERPMTLLHDVPQSKQAEQTSECWVLMSSEMIQWVTQHLCVWASVHVCPRVNLDGRPGCLQTVKKAIRQILAKCWQLLNAVQKQCFIIVFVYDSVIGIVYRGRSWQGNTDRSVCFNIVWDGWLGQQERWRAGTLPWFVACCTAGRAWAEYRLEVSSNLRVTRFNHTCVICLTSSDGQVHCWEDFKITDLS